MFLKDFYCFRCGTRQIAEELNHRCLRCEGLLIADYDYDKISRFLNKEDLLHRAPTIWRYKELLPLADESNIVTKGEGMTPILPLKKIGKEMGLARLFMKDESLMPCDTFKARGASVAVSRALEAGCETIVAVAEAAECFAWACYAAAAGIGAVLLSPAAEMTPALENAIRSTGAKLNLYEGSAPEAERLAQRSAETHGWFHVSAFYEPYRLEGKKTLAFEILEAFEWKLPDVIICPANRDGAFLGIYRGLRDLQRLGWIPAKLPRLVAVQEEGNAPIVKAWEARRTEVVPSKSSDPTVPLHVDEDLKFEGQGAHFVLDGVYKSLGCAAEVGAARIDEARAKLAAREGIIASRNGASTLAAAVKLSAAGWLGSGERVLMISPDSGRDSCEGALSEGAAVDLGLDALADSI